LSPSRLRTGPAAARSDPALATRLGIPFVDRAIPLAVAEQLEIPVEDAEAHDAKVETSWIERLLRGYIGADTGNPVPVPGEISGLDRKTAERALHHTDRAHAEYARTCYGVSLDDPALFHVMIDSTLIPLDACVELIATGATALATRVQA
jgi:hypothetical protein